MPDSAQDRLNGKIEEIKREYGPQFERLFKEVNRTRLKSKGKLAAPSLDRNTLRWTLAWKENKISFDLNIIVGLADDGTRARVDRVWVHRHASTAVDYEGHTPTTRMRRLTNLSMVEIKEAIEAELK